MYSKVVVPLDGTDAAERVITEVKHLLAPGGVIHVLQVVRPPDVDGQGRHGRPPGEVFGRHLGYGVALVRWHSCTARVVSAVVSNSSVSDGILRYAIAVSADSGRHVHEVASGLGYTEPAVRRGRREGQGADGCPRARGGGPDACRRRSVGLVRSPMNYLETRRWGWQPRK